MSQGLVRRPLKTILKGVKNSSRKNYYIIRIFLKPFGKSDKELVIFLLGAIFNQEQTKYQESRRKRKRQYEDVAGSRIPLFPESRKQAGSK